MTAPVPGLDPNLRPTWARFLSEPEWRGFAVALAAELERRAAPFRVDDAVLWGRWGSDEDEALGLTNLAQLCHASVIESYGDIIASHFDALVAGRGDRAQADRLGTDLAAARPVLRLRLYARDTFADDVDQFVLRDVADDLTAVLCYDLPANVVTVTADTLPRWGVPPDEPYYQALANQRRVERAPVEDVDVGGAIIHAMTGDSYFIASNLLLLGDLVPDEPPLGVIAAVPNRHTLVWHPIVDPSALRALDAMVVMAASLFADGPGAISPNLYWWRDGVLKTLPTRETEEHYEFVPPDEFVDEVLEELAQR
ncbi:MAG: hypothetical protein R3B06_16355, partial [Kofleriaceae bacterium]